MSVESQVKSVFNREVTLKSGATIVFDATEALTAIDINSARATRGTSIEDTAFKANLDSAEEIAVQLQLRDIGGLIVIDFIDMASEENRVAIEKAMEKATANDRARVQIGTISRFGLLELSRQRLMSSVAESTGKTCSQCNGSGTTPTIPTLALKIIRQLEDSLNSSKNNGDITIQSSVDVVTYLLNEKRQNINDLEVKHGIKITLLPNQYMHFPNFSINKQKGDKKPQHKSFQGISKPQINPNEINYLEKLEMPVIEANHPSTKMPERKVSFMSKLSDMFTVEKQERLNKNLPDLKIGVRIGIGTRIGIGVRIGIRIGTRMQAKNKKMLGIKKVLETRRVPEIRTETATRTETAIRRPLQATNKNRLKRLLNRSIYEQIRCHWQSYSS